MCTRFISSLPSHCYSRFQKDLLHYFPSWACVIVVTRHASPRQSFFFTCHHRFASHAILFQMRPESVIPRHTFSHACKNLFQCRYAQRVHVTYRLFPTAESATHIIFLLRYNYLIPHNWGRVVTGRWLCDSNSIFSMLLFIFSIARKKCECPPPINGKIRIQLWSFNFSLHIFR